MISSDLIRSDLRKSAFIQFVIIFFGVAFIRVAVFVFFVNLLKFQFGSIASTFFVLFMH